MDKRFDVDDATQRRQCALAIGQWSAILVACGERPTAPDTWRDHQ